MDTNRTAPTQIPELVEVRVHSEPKARPVRVVVELAADQDGVVEHDQLLALEVGEEWIKHKLRIGWLTIVFRGVYAVGHKRITWRGRLRAAVLSCGPGAYLSHHTAAVLHGLWRYWGGVIHVTAPPGGREDREEGIVVHRIRNMRAVEKGEVDGLPVTSVARTCLDMAARVHPDTLDDMVEAAERNETFDLAAFMAVCKRGRTGSAALKRALLRYQPTGWTRSRLERRAIRELRQAGVRIVGVNVWIPEADLEADLLLEHKVVVEIDGGVVHGTTAAKIRDPDRDLKLQLAGYTPIRIPEYRLVHEPERVVADVKALLLSRAARTPARPGR
jgi:predicted transcriptional regulator of viral defense system